MLRKSLRLLTLVALLGALVPLAAAQNVSGLRVMLHPDAADGGQLSDATLSLLQSLAGVPLTLAATTRTGALEFTLTPPLDAAASAAMLDRMRNDRSVLWVEPVTTAPATAKIMSAPQADGAPDGRKVMLRLTSAAAPDWATLLPRLAAVAGSTAGSRPPDRGCLGTGRRQRDSRCAARANGRADSIRPCSSVRRSGASRHQAIGTERHVLLTTMAALGSRRRRQRADGVEHYDWQCKHGRGGRRHGSDRAS